MAQSSRPPVVSAQEWQQVRDELLTAEKEHTRALDRLAARRRRLPMVRIDGDYRFTAPDGTTVGLTDLFDGKRQLIVYHFMQEPDQDWLCGGCCSFTDNVDVDQAHLAARDTRLVLVAGAPQEQLAKVHARMGWSVPWYSSHGSDFDRDLKPNDAFGLSVLLRDGDEVFRTYYTDGRGVDRLRVDFNLLDLTPYGRQEEWEDSPAGWPQTPTMQWIRLKDEYGASA